MVLLLPMTTKPFLCPLNKQLIVSALSPARTDITVTKVHSYGNGINVFKIVKWVVKNKYNNTVFIFQREKLKESWRLTLNINGVDIVGKQDDSFMCKLEHLLDTKEHQQKFMNITEMARKIMSKPNGAVYDHLVSTLQR